MIRPLFLTAIVLGMLFPLTAAMGDNGVNAQSSAQSRGTLALSNGQFAQAVTAWSDALARTQAAGDAEGQINALIYRSLAYQELGHMQLALADLKRARGLAQQAGDTGRV